MVLATVIRLELAYPGVGIFAGDSLQYLSLATAHGVIMVFFMIIPLLSGAFANFLLPTQLGVHDVAFPRLNSAAFWFLPGGLIMLGQLICLDRRYQRMNCFNIREVQSLLKRRFFTDLINSNDHHELLDQTMLGLRFKTNNLNSLNSHVILHNNFGLTSTGKTRFTINQEANIFDTFTFLKSDSFFFNTINFFYQKLNFFFITPTNWSPYLNFFSLQNSNTELSPLGLTLWNFISSFYFKFLAPFFFVCHWIFNLIFYFVSFLLNFRFVLYFLIKDTSATFYYLIRSFYFFSSFVISVIFKLFFGTIGWIWHLRRKRWFFESINMYVDMRYVFIPLIYFPRFDDFKLKAKRVLATKEFDLFLSNWLVYFESLISSFRLFRNFKFNHIDTNSLFNRCKYYYNYLYVTTHQINHTGLHAYFNSYQNNEIYTYSTITHNLLVDNRFSINNTTAKTSQTSWKQKTSSPNVLAVYEYTMLTINILQETLFYAWINIKYSTDFIEIFFLNREFHSFLSNWYVPLLFNTDAVDQTAFLLQWHCSDWIVRFLRYSNEKIQYFLYEKDGLKKLVALDKSISVGIILEKPSVLFNAYYSSYRSFMFFCETFSFFSRIILTWIFNTLKTAIVTTNPRYRSSTVIKNNEKIFSSNVSSRIELNNLTLGIKYKNEDIVGQRRSLRFDNPIFRYDYKSGDYFPKFNQETYTHLLSTLAGITGGLRTSPWFFSPSSYEALSSNFFNFFQTAVSWNWRSGYNTYNWTENRLLNSHTFYHFFLLLNKDTSKFNNMRWTSFDTLNQKFIKMFATSSMQQRVYSNWRQLKFTREAWRCKLLSARHQKNLFRRYVHENGVFWSIEKNARDLLPGWAMITPFSSRTRFTAIGKVDIGVSAIILVLISSIVSGVNFLVTYRYLSTLNNRKMRDARSFFTEGIMCSSWMMIAANPMLIIGLIMLLSDRHWQTSFFDYSGGGDTILFQHMFWFFGHPEVYIVIIPTFGFVNTLFSYYLKKRISARASLLYSIYTIAFLGFFVWGHHMYMVGLSHTTRMLFSTLTVMISVPAATKLMHWCVTLVNSSFTFELPFLFMLTYVFLFVSGGISGMCVAHTGMDVLFHDTFYVIGHFHVMFAGAAMFGSFGAFYFYFSAIFGVKYSRVYAYLHFTYYLLGQLLTVIPMFWLGYAGMPRRVLDYPSAFGGWHSVITAGHMLSVAGLISFFIMIFDSLRQSKAATRNNFGIMRYNTRLNFYLYEIARVLFTQRRGSHLYRYYHPTALKLNGYHYTNYEYLETTLFSYTFNKKNL
jgi:heme/copper-type cytochrome/quinol oxidase subunit 1